MRDGALVYIHSLGSFRFGGRGGMFFLRISHKVPRESFSFFDIDNVQCSICICSRNFPSFFGRGIEGCFAREK